MAEKSVKTKDLRTKSDAELVELVSATKNQLFEARFQNYTNRLNDTSRLSRLRRELARLNTIVGERQRSATTAAKGEG